MSGLYPLFRPWRNASIGFKFTAIMGFMLLLILLTALTGSVALRQTLYRVESMIISTTDIRELALEIDRELQYARQLERAFFFQVPRIGFSQAMTAYGEPLQRHVRVVIRLTNRLRALLQESPVSQELREAVVQLDFYLSAAERYAEAFSESTLLVSELAKEDTGRQNSLFAIGDVLVERLEFLDHSDLQLLFRTAQTYLNRYLATRQRSDMQAFLNELQHLEGRIQMVPDLPEVSRSELLNILRAHAYIADQILELDQLLDAKFQEFDLRIDALQPISNELVTLARLEVDRARKSIDQIGWNATLLLLAAVVCSVVLGLTSALVMRSSIIRNLANLTAAADRIRGGDLQSRVTVHTRDEVGMLAETFNTMAARIAVLMQDLQQRVEITRSRLFQGIESIEEGFALFDRHGSLVLANQNVIRMLPPLEKNMHPGVSFQDCLTILLDSGLIHFEPLDGSDAAHQWLKENLAAFNNGAGTKEVCLSSERLLRLRYFRVENGETVVLLEDVTEHRRLEEERLEMERRLLHSQKLESLGVLAGGIAHDFNNLLSAMMGNMELALTMPELGAPARKRVEQGLLAARRAADLTRQMLAYSGKGGFDVRPVMLNDIVQDNAHIFQTAMGVNVQFELGLAPSLPLIQADAGQLQQVIMNLITNAAEAIGYQPGTMAVTTRLAYCDASCMLRSCIAEKPKPGWFVWLEVRDTGVGMNEEVLSRLFDPFYSTKFTGRGLGLSAVMGIVRGHGGAIFVESAPGVGTTFQVLFPVDNSVIINSPPVEQRLIPTQDVNVDNNMVASTPKTVLVVDDEDMVRDLSIEALQHLGYATLSARDGLEALQLFQEYREQIGCVLLDLMMPKMDGVATFFELRKIAHDVPVILCSGYSAQEVEQRFTENGPGAFLQKPFTIEDLRWALLNLMANGATGYDPGLSRTA